MSTTHKMVDEAAALLNAHQYRWLAGRLVSAKHGIPNVPVALPSEVAGLVDEYANKIIERASESGSFDDGEVQLLLKEFASKLWGF